MQTSFVDNGNNIRQCSVKYAKIKNKWLNIFLYIDNFKAKKDPNDFGEIRQKKISDNTFCLIFHTHFIKIEFLIHIETSDNY